MAHDLIDAFLDGLRDVAMQFTTDFVAERMGTTPQRARRAKVKPPKAPKVPKQPKARKESGPTLYQVLGVDRTAEPEVIEAAWKAKARLYHPDRNKTASAAEKIKAVNNAHDVFSDPEKRKEYDRSLRG